jgi:hypothetical protein
LRLENPIINWKEGRVEIRELEKDKKERSRHFLKEEKAP